MREIKFRAWDIHRKQMLEVWKVTCGVFPKPAELYNRDFDDLFNKDDAILMQFTGFKDKNGKEIYEGDIILSQKYPREIFFNEETCEWRLATYGEKQYDKTYSLCPFARFGEIIGNIYENPEILKRR